MKHTFHSRRLTGSLLSLLSFLVGGICLSAACLSSAAPVSYLKGGAWIAFCISMGVNAFCQLCLTVTDRGLAALDQARGGTFLTGILAALATLAFAAGTFVLGVKSEGTAQVTAMISAVLALLGTVGLALRSVFPGRYPGAEVLTTLPLPLACVFYALYLYFEATAPRNGSFKLLLSLCFLLLALYLLSDIRHSLGTPKPRVHCFIGRLAAPLLGSAALAALVLQVGRGLYYLSAPVYLFLAAFFLYIYIRLIPAFGVSRPAQNPASDTDEDAPSDPHDHLQESE